MKHLLATLAAALAFMAGAWAENGYRANFWFPGTYEPGTTKPFVYHMLAEADSEAEVRAWIYEQDPKAVIESIEYLGVVEWAPPDAPIADSPYNNVMDPPAEETGEPEIAEGIDHSGEPGLPVEWEEYTIQK
jgi:hypothetical protein